MKIRMVVLLALIGLGWVLLTGCQLQGNAGARNAGGPVSTTAAAASQTLDQIQAGLQNEEPRSNSAAGAAQDLEQDLDMLEQQLNQPVP